MTRCNADFTADPAVVEKAQALANELHDLCTKNGIPAVILVNYETKTVDGGHEYAVLAMVNTTRSCRTSPKLQLAELAVNEGMGAAMVYAAMHTTGLRTSTVDLAGAAKATRQ